MELQHRLLRHVDILYMQAILYIAEARSPTIESMEDLPRTARHSHPPDQPLILALYRRAFEKANEIHRLLSSADTTVTVPEDLDSIYGKEIALLPLQFEALLYLSAFEFSTDEFGLGLLITQATERSASQKTYALMADLVLSATLPDTLPGEGVAANDTIRTPHPHLPITTAVNLLRKLINAVRRLDDYDLAQASRWIRCVVQTILDSGTALTDISSLKMLDEITPQAVILANSIRNENDGDVPIQGASVHVSYPADELEWLCTTLFNLALDLMVAGMEDKAKQWAGRAGEVADTLAIGVDGDRGVLARVLRERCGRLGWL